MKEDLSEPSIHLKASNSLAVDVLTQLEAEIDSHPIIDHPFLIQLREGRLSESQVGSWVTQQLHFSRQFPRCLAALYARLPDVDISAPLLRFLSVEHWSSSDESAHWKQFAATLTGFGFDLDDIKCRAPFDETREYLSFRLDHCLNATVEEALGNIAFAHEYVNASIFDSYLRGVEKLSILEEPAVRYFRSHTEDEPYDYQIIKEIILSNDAEGGEITLVRKGALEVLNARSKFFDSMLRRVQVTGPSDDLFRDS